MASRKFCFKDEKAEKLDCHHRVHRHGLVPCVHFQTFIRLMRPAPGVQGMSVPTFVVGTGRCGSTMLSNMLRKHPKVLSLSEFFSMVAAASGKEDAYSPGSMDGRRFWSIVAAISPMPKFGFRHRIPMPEWLYP